VKLTAANVRKSHERLSAFYGRLPERRKLEPLDSLIQTILSQNTSDANSGRAFASLKRAFPDWNSVEQAPEGAIASAIRSGGLAKTKSKTIKGVLGQLRTAHGAPTLECLHAMNNDDAMAYLMSLKGVGVKTAACVLMFSLNRPVFPVDTHVYRVTNRLGWLPSNVKAPQATRYLQPSIPDEIVLSLHLYLVMHGRQICKARRPFCSRCPLRQTCHTFREKAIESR
jgi:endonuclease-3